MDPRIWLESRSSAGPWVQPYRQLATAAALNTKKTGKKHPGKAILAGKLED